jgi:predicted NAD-dependent protein-ADP-ribosyltransferase YbiA (DUF1768 family)
VVRIGAPVAPIRNDETSQPVRQFSVCFSEGLYKNQLVYFGSDNRVPSSRRIRILDAVTDIPRSADELVARTGPVKYLFFWGHRPQADGSLGAGCLSQWWPAEFTVDGVRFRSAEHYMMWRKATLFGDTAMSERIQAAVHPRDVKMLGGSLAKFGQHDDLRAWLAGTGDRVLVEASPTDRVWGIGLAASDARASDPVRWRGLNLLGFALMQAREQLRSR